MFGADTRVLEDLLEGLFHIAVADGEYHPAEDDFLCQVSRIFDLDDRAFRAIRTRFVPDAPPDPYEVLEVLPEDDLATIRAAWRRQVRESHPDRVIARGLPEEAIKMAEKRLVAVNRAWEEISRDRAA